MELQCYALFLFDFLSEFGVGGRGQVGHVEGVGISVLISNLNLITLLGSLIVLNRVDIYSHGEVRVLIYFVHSHGWRLAESTHGGSDLADSNWLACLKASENLKTITLLMSKQLQSNDVLEGINKGSISVAPLAVAAIGTRRDMPCNDH